MPEFASTIHSLCRAGTDYSVRQLSVALLCHEHRDDSAMRGVKPIAAAMKVSKPAVTRAMDRLAEEGLGSRKVDPLDRRLIIFTLTAKGREFVAPLVVDAEKKGRKP